TQDAVNAQVAGALSGVYQTGASNSNLPVRVLSPGSNGAVTQSNDASSTGTSTNTNTTSQTSDQDASGGSCGCAAAPSSSSPGIQSADQSAENAQLARAASSATQVNPSNTDISVRVLSPGNDGAVDQSN